MRLHDLLGSLDVLELVGDPHVEVGPVTHDSRRTGPGALFCCIPGRTADGHEHAAAAVAAGAAALLVERRLPLTVTQVRVASVRAAIGPIAARAEGEPSRAVRVLGVTGTNGKTTTTFLLDAIARAAGERSGIVGTLGVRMSTASEGCVVETEHTTPEAPELQATLSRLRDAGVTTVAMEVSSHALAQHRVDGTRFAAACFTNLTHEHLDFHGSTDAYFEAKARLFTPELTGQAAVNVEEARGRALAVRAARAGLEVRTFGIDVPADVRVEFARGNAAREGAMLVAGDHRAELRLALIGRFNLENAAAAAATALVAGLPFEAVVAGLSAAGPVPGRLERVEVGQPFTVLVDYAHTPDALSRSLGAARELALGSGRVLAVLGCGGDRDRDKRPLMGRVAAERADVVVVTSDNPRSEDPRAIAEAMVAGAGSSAVVELDRRRAIAIALAEARAGDVVVIAGKGHETGQTAGGVTVPFDDRLVARAELEARSWT